MLPSQMEFGTKVQIFFQRKKRRWLDQRFHSGGFQAQWANSPLKHIDFRAQTKFGHGELRFLSQEGLPFAAFGRTRTDTSIDISS